MAKLTSGTRIYGNVTIDTFVTATGNITGGNILTAGAISTTGNISANNATFTSNQTLSYGTANGVAYLNGSKVLTTGSALVFDGTNFSTTGTIKGATTIGVGAATPSTSGAGITFPATQSASADANTLDDYEEGTFTPTCTLSTPGTSATTGAVGVYTKIGNLVSATGRLTFTKGTGTGDLSFGGLPFTSTSTATYQNSGAISLDSVGASGKVYYFVLANSSTAPILVSVTQVGGVVAVASATDLGVAGATIRYMFSYQV